MRITIHDSAAECRFQVRGVLAGDAVRELALCWRTASSTTHRRRTVLDVCHLASMDDAGRELLERMARSGVVIVREPAPHTRRDWGPFLHQAFRCSLVAVLLLFPPCS